MKVTGLPYLCGLAIIMTILSAMVRAQSAVVAQWQREYDLGTEAYEQCQFQKANKHYTKALAELAKTDVVDARAVKTLNALGKCYRATGSFDKAEVALKRALSLAEAWLGPSHLATADALANLGALYAATRSRRFAEAQLLLEKALSIREDALGKEDPDVADSLEKLGELYLCQGDYHRAALFLTRALGIQEKVFGPTDLRIAGTLEDLAWLKTREGANAEAERSYLRVLDLYQAVLPADHCELGSTLRSYASLLRKMGRNAEAEKLEARAIAIALKTK